MKAFIILTLSLISLSLFGATTRPYIPDENHLPPDMRPSNQSSNLNLRQAQEIPPSPKNEKPQTQRTNTSQKNQDLIIDDLKEPSDTKMD